MHTVAHKTKTSMSGPKYLIFVSSTQVFRSLQPLLMALLHIPVQFSLTKAVVISMTMNVLKIISIIRYVLAAKYSLCFELPR